MATETLCAESEVLVSGSEEERNVESIKSESPVGDDGNLQSESPAGGDGNLQSGSPAGGDGNLQSGSPAVGDGSQAWGDGNRQSESPAGGDEHEHLQSDSPAGGDGSLADLELLKKELFQDEDDTSSDYGSHDKPGTALPSLMPNGNMLFPEVFQTNHLLFYERFKAYQDYILADCKPSEVLQFTMEYLEKFLEPSGWAAIWRTNVFEVLVEVVDVEYSTLKAVVRLSEPFLCESNTQAFTEECLRELLKAKEQRVPLQELCVVFDESGEFDQTVLAIEHIRFFYRHIWRRWDEEDEDEFDYFVRCVEPRLRLHYDILEGRVPSGMVAEYQNLLSQCEELYKRFTDLRNNIAISDSESESDNVSMVEVMKMYEQMEKLKRKLTLIENPLLRYIFGYQKHVSLHPTSAKGLRPKGGKVIHVVSTSMTVSLLQSLTRDRLYPESCNQELEIQFHSDALTAVNSCFEGDIVIFCPGHYSVQGYFSITDSIELEGYGFPDDIVIEKQGKGDNFVDCTAANVKISNMKFVQHDAVEGIISIYQGTTTLDNCVLQCETTGVTVRTSAILSMKYSDLYGAKGAGVEIYPGSTCNLIGNGIHHCKEGILIKDFIDEVYDIPKITMENNVIHNNEGYAVVLVKAVAESTKKNATDNLEGRNSGMDEAPINPVPDSTEADAHNEQEAGAIEGSAEERKEISEQVEGNDAITSELVATLKRKSQIHKKRLSDMGITEADDDLMSQEMFVSIAGNQFKRNGKGSFGTFLF
uniref:SHC SH2 domain-binding protein 1 n=1 Tax=Geotrypetes seraphini TaxID=260995 RepID=A0A6P8QHQ0_GEOSA|nr:SHC SH2 domain-binding protein 1 [Geotrypetes seraphini]